MDNSKEKFLIGTAIVLVLIIAFAEIPALERPAKKFFGGTSPTATSDPTKTSAQTPTPTGSKLLFSEGFELGKIGPGWTSIGVNTKATPPSLEVVPTPVRKGAYALKVIVRPEDAVYRGDVINDKERAELVRQKFEATEGRELWYAWSILLPEDYAYTRDGSSFQIMGQWHDESDPGEEPSGYSPPLRVIYRPDLGSVLSFTYGRIQEFDDPQQTIDVPITLGAWTDLMFRIKFSQGNDGFAEVYKNGVQISKRITGPNMFNNQPNYLRIGLYRGPKKGGTGQPQINTLYYDEIKIGTTKESVLTR